MPVSGEIIVSECVDYPIIGLIPHALKGLLIVLAGRLESKAHILVGKHNLDLEEVLIWKRLLE